MRRAVLLLGLAAMAGGCWPFGGSKYFYGPLGQVVAQPKPSSCAFTLLDKAPEQAYDSLGVLAPVDIGARKLAADEAAFKKAVASEICAAGGDAVVVERNAEGRYVRGTVVRWR